MFDLRDLAIGIVGLAESGVGAANLCQKHGARVTVYDTKPMEQVADRIRLLSPEVIVRAEAKPEKEDLAGMNLLILSPAVPADLPFVLEAKAIY